ncbi:MAG: GAF domain-containing protein [Chloroflexota bacterium]
MGGGIQYSPAGRTRALNQSGNSNEDSRIEIMRQIGLLDSERDPFFDCLPAFISPALNVPISLVTMITSDCQFFKSSIGLPEPLKTRRCTSLSHSLCQHIILTGQPLIVADARKVSFLKDNPAVLDLNVVAYLGVPLRSATGDRLGTLCAIDFVPHTWQMIDVTIIHAFAKVANAEIVLRTQAYNTGRLNPYIDESSEMYRAILELILMECRTKVDLVHKLLAFAGSLLHSGVDNPQN